MDIDNTLIRNAVQYIKDITSIHLSPYHPIYTYSPIGESLTSNISLYGWSIHDLFSTLYYSTPIMWNSFMNHCDPNPARGARMPSQPNLFLKVYA